MSREIMKIKDLLVEKLIIETKKKKDTNSKRIKRLLNLPDLSRKEKSPIKFIVDAILSIERFKDFDIIEIPEVVSVKNNFDLLNTPINHPSRKKTDTYYLNEKYVLRTHTTTMWPFYIKHPKVQEKIKNNEELKALCYGKVYRKDEIDRNHFPAFHQIDGLYICKKEKKIIKVENLKEVLIDIAKKIYGNSVKYKVLKDSFPFTDPSIQVEIKRDEDWLEILGAGIVHKEVLKKLNLDPSIYNGWAFGFGLERLAMIKMNVPDIRVFWSNDERITRQFKDINSKYEEVSKFPMTSRDISFIVDQDTELNSYYEIVRDYGKDLVEEVILIDKYKNPEKIGKNKISYTFRIIYRSHERTLTNEEINRIQAKIRRKTSEELKAQLR
ncbi:MAG: hypothetical protein GF387_03465 [Candidatus Portnoybacteria bacterium]|nr:hypothetical protein [Candidatus Portnoybacteria bacterium]